MEVFRGCYDDQIEGLDSEIEAQKKANFTVSGKIYKKNSIILPDCTKPRFSGSFFLALVLLLSRTYINP
jgi:hypothetical protein